MSSSDSFLKRCAPVRAMAFAALLSTMSPERAADAWPLAAPARNGALAYTSADSAFQWQLDARVQIDAAVYRENKNQLSNGTAIRRGRFGVDAFLWDTWCVELDVDVGGGVLDLDDAWAGYASGNRRFRIGQFKEPFSLERLTSSARLVFMERALPSVLAPGRKIGMALAGYGERWFAEAGLFGQEADQNDAGEDEGYGITARGVFIPISTPRSTTFLGVSATRRTPDANGSDADAFRFRVTPETHVNRDHFLDTGRINGATSLTTIGFEAAGTWGGTWAQAEHIRSQVARSPRADARLQGSYISAGWVVRFAPHVVGHHHLAVAKYPSQNAEVHTLAMAFGDPSPVGSRVGRKLQLLT